jgi:hypothetical protein
LRLVACLLCLLLPPPAWTASIFLVTILPGIWSRPNSVSACIGASSNNVCSLPWLPDYIRATYIPSLGSWPRLQFAAVLRLLFLNKRSPLSRCAIFLSYLTAFKLAVRHLVRPGPLRHETCGASSMIPSVYIPSIHDLSTTFKCRSQLSTFPADKRSKSSFSGA